MRPVLFVLGVLSSSVALAAPTCVNVAADGREYDLCHENIGITWNDAEQYCNTNYGTSLGTIDSALQQSAIADARNLEFPGQHVWIGLNDISIEGDYVWSSGDPVSFTFYNAGEPNNVGNEDCTHFWGSLADGRWNDIPCNTGAIQAFVCDIDVPMVASLTDRMDDMVEDANAIYGAAFGTVDPVNEGAHARLRPSVLETRLQAVVDELTNAGCTVDDTNMGHAAGIYAPGLVDGEDDAGNELTSASFTPGTKSFGWNQTGVTAGDAGGFDASYNRQGRMLAQRAETDGFVAGRWVRVSGLRGVFLTLTGTCDENVDPHALLGDGWF